MTQSPAKGSLVASLSFTCRADSTTTTSDAKRDHDAVSLYSVVTTNLEAEASVQPLTKFDLKERFGEWFASQPEISRCRSYSMAELERALGTQGRFLSAVLLALGWERRRKWSSTGQSPRYWVPPAA